MLFVSLGWFTLPLRTDVCIAYCWITSGDNCLIVAVGTNRINYSIRWDGIERCPVGTFCDAGSHISRMFGAVALGSPSVRSLYTTLCVMSLRYLVDPASGDMLR